MIDHVSLYLHSWDSTTPICCIQRGNCVSHYNLTQASAQRLARACRRLKGYFWVDGHGWMWQSKQEK